VPSPSRRILVVDDEWVINQAVSDRLAAEAYDVIPALAGGNLGHRLEDNCPALLACLLSGVRDAVDLESGGVEQSDQTSVIAQLDQLEPAQDSDRA
jgi:hypothetical protein